MSEEESEKEENENEENEDNENEEKEDNENEENENEENEDEEKSEEEKNKKKEKKKEEKFEEQKLIPSNEIKIDLSNTQNNNNNNNNFNFNNNNNLNFEIKKNIFQILNEINNDMEILSKEINSTLKFVDSKKPSFSYKNEEEDLQTLLKKANDLCKEIDLNHKKTENKAIQSDDEFDFKKFNNNDYNNNNYQNTLKDFPYDPNKNRDYYNSLNESMQNYQQQQNNYYQNNNNFNNFPNNNNNNNNNFYSLPQPNLNNNFPLMSNNNNINNNNFMTNNNNNNNNNFLNRFNNIGSSRVKRIDDLYRNQYNSNRGPSIYTQPETNKLNPVLLNKQNNLPPKIIPQNNDFNNINSMSNRPFERNKPGSIAQAMDILLDKQ